MNSVVGFIFNENLCEKKKFFCSWKQCMEPTEKAFQSQNAVKKKKKKKHADAKVCLFLCIQTHLQPNLEK